jgi:DNA-directed RNA polymerase III subunit RPC1
VLKKAKKNTKCPHCDSTNGAVKKGAGLMKIVHEPLRGKKKTDPLVTNALDELLAAAKNNKEMEQTIGPASLIQELNPVEVLSLFKNIPKVDIPLLGMTALDSNPINLIVTRVYVPPACIRPSVVSEIKSGT